MRVTRVAVAWIITRFMSAPGGAMYKKSLITPLAVTAMLIAACGKEPAQETAAPAATETDTQATETTVTEAEKLHALFEEAWDEVMEMNPTYASFVGINDYNDRFSNSIGPEYRAQSLAMNERFLAALDDIDETQLEGQDYLSYDIFKRNAQTSIESFKYPGYLQPINQFFSTPNSFAQLGSGGGVHPFSTVKDYEDFLGRIDGFVIWMDQATENMREGMQQGVEQPQVLMERVLPQLQAHVVDNVEDSIFWRPIANMPEDFSDEDKARLTEAYRTAIETQLVPAYSRVHDYIRDEYIPNIRETVGLYDLPNGDNWYAFLVRRTTTTDLTPDEIHDIGLAEVARIHEEMRGVMEETGFEGDLKDFFEFMNTDEQFYFDTEEELLTAYNDLRDVVHPLADKLFTRFPEADYEIRAVEPFRAKSASGASYRRASPDGSRPGVFYVNTYDLSARPAWAVESLFLHEAVPGHHFQGALAMETEELPMFRKYLFVTAYGEGWGLYSESLGKELGIYTDPYQYFGMLNAELWRAIRLVTDTGIHKKGWTRQQVLDYMYANSAVKEARAVSEAERFMAIPSQALAYKIGQLKIKELRKRSEDALGDKFDVKAFHGQVLDDGPLPLDVLEAKIDRWIASQS